MLSHLPGIMLGIILVIFGVIAVEAYLAKGRRSGRLGLAAMVITVAANTLGLPITGWSAFAAPAIGRAYVLGIDDAKRIDVGSDFIVIFMLTILLAFVGNVLLGVAIWRSRTLPKWAGAI